MKITKDCIHEDGTPFSKEEFINKIKTDDEFAKKWGELGPVYGKQWRDWGGRPVQSLIEKEIVGGNWVKGIDQLANAINDLKTNPDSRRIIVSAWNPEDIESSILPPCHNFFQFYTRELSLAERLNLVSTIIGEEKIRTHEDNLARVEKLNVPTRAISLLFNMRSTDVPLGLPFNIASYGLLLEIVAKEVNMVPEELIGNLGDTHIYLNQIEGIKEQLTREPYELPTLHIVKHSNEDPSIIEKPKYWRSEDFLLENYKSHSSIKIPLSN